MCVVFTLIGELFANCQLKSSLQVASLYCTSVASSAVERKPGLPTLRAPGRQSSFQQNSQWLSCNAMRNFRAFSNWKCWNCLSLSHLLRLPDDVERLLEGGVPRLQFGAPERERTIDTQYDECGTSSKFRDGWFVRLLYTCLCTASTSNLRTMLPESGSRPLPAKRPYHAT